MLLTIEKCSHNLLIVDKYFLTSIHIKETELKIGTTNNDPAITVYYFLECLHHVKIASKVMKSNKGTDNVYLWHAT